jgi:hypothetical protein
MLSPNFWIIITLVTGMGIADYAVSKFFGIFPINNKKLDGMYYKKLYSDQEKFPLKPTNRRSSLIPNKYNALLDGPGETEQYIPSKKNTQD